MESWLVTMKELGLFETFLNSCRKILTFKFRKVSETRLSTRIRTMATCCDNNCLSHFNPTLIENTKTTMSLFNREQAIEYITNLLADQATSIKPHVLHFKFNNIDVCSRAFGEIYGLSKHGLENVRTRLHQLGMSKFQALLSKQEQLHHETNQDNRHQLLKEDCNLKSIEIAIAWIHQWIERRRAYVDENGVSVVVYDFQWNKVYEEMKSELKEKTVALRTFYYAKEEVLSTDSIRFHRPNDHPICNTCVQYHLALKNPSHDIEVVFSI